MQVLFLGGPWHGERHDVPPCRKAHGAASLPALYSVARPPADADPTSARVVYTRRFAQGGGERRPVYVAPDYRGPARA
ncbi:hypothetical protein [Phytohabitans aurantiacus]|jgi:hypothetical protein|uniref:Uncharacterized protein n=1 Tax=Phytohabitans aurantiacus TaxID=3016789 RepID=A0ABQ5R7L8_9ACTN|nr:hypothetical protein [Phytohabitans aurantiacus]GLI02365.1 hypothetical protein Pa4123_76430 [Phytohabitans aurantiacus]